ncbi:MAG TPA: recombinase family protein [Candidatus Saccharimonadales bacterium]|nr:recombinase family protein [Candidatus Saccharimonadales bacterium]
MARRVQVDIKTLRYVLYARKSTEDENRQVRSIDDQIKECRKLAYELGLNVVDVIRETKSAKKPGQRPLFFGMIQDIVAEKYDAVLCWHPDRLSRNMLESGQIIQLLDEDVLKDIRFHSHQFSNDANGKMLLGMLFVFSKQYSDDLSDKVSRGVGGNFSEGRSSGSPKWGYERDEITGYYEPNQYFDPVREAWMMRYRGETCETIKNYLVKKGYHRVTKSKKRRVIKPSVHTVGKMLEDPFYYGLLQQAGQTVWLPDICNFKPMITEEVYNQVQAISRGHTRDVSPQKRKTFYPLRGMVSCAICNSPKYMATGKSKSHTGQHNLYYRCDSPHCTRSPKSLRARNVFGSINDLLDHIELTNEAYARYSAFIDGKTDQKIIEIKQKIESLRGARKHIASDVEKRSLEIVEYDKKSPIYIANEKQINKNAHELQLLDTDITKLEEKIVSPSRIKLKKSEFLNLIKTASDKMKAGSAVEKDALCRILFLNLRVDNEKIVEYLWNEPFASLVKVTELATGGDERT